MASRQSGDQRQEPHGWRPDVLGGGYECRTLPLPPDSMGPSVATLVRAPAPDPPPRPSWVASLLAQPADPRPLAGVDVLYIHGWKDYFFQTHVAEFFRGLGAQFWAIDLRRYGRSLREGEQPGFIDDLELYDQEIEAALAVMGYAPRLGGDAHDRGIVHSEVELEPAPRRLLLFGHSTGGLTFALWADRHPGIADGLLLNSPWLELQINAFARQVITPVVELSTRRGPTAQILQANWDFYGKSTDKDFFGEWEFNHDWRPNTGWPITAAWSNAILAGHAKVKSGLRIQEPILMLLSRRSTLQPRWSDTMLTTDTAINVELVAKRGLRLGDSVTITRIDRALHDVFLSRADVREVAFGRVRQWIEGWARADRLP